MVSVRPLRSEKNRLASVIGESSAWKAILNALNALSRAPSSISVLLTGETGTGKEVVARALHEQSDRAGKPFIAINCAAIPSDLLESVLFGYEKGAFTGALSRTTGKFEQADGGTILLDEIGDMPLPLQAKPLRVLQEKQIDRVGGREPVDIDVRILTATHRNLRQEVISRRFREDLYYRLNIYPIELPPLRERISDIPLLVNYFSDRLCTKGYPSLTITDAALDILMRYFWPGNVRELQNLVEWLAVQRLNGHSGQIVPEDLPSYLCHPLVDSLRTDYADNQCSVKLTPAEKLGFSVPQPKISDDNFSLPDMLRQIERTYIEQAMQRANGNISEAARLLGVPRTTLFTRVQSLNIPYIERRRSVRSLKNI